MNGTVIRWPGLAFIALLVAPSVAFAQADEIQVYDGGLAPVGVFNLTWHNNYTPDGAKDPAFEGGIVSDDALVGVAEWAYGVSDWFEAGLYLPLYSIDKAHDAGVNGAKLRALFAVPNADERTFFYGVNFEFSYNAKRWDPKRITSEVRPIVGWHLGRVDLIANPIVDTNYEGGLGALELVPAARAAYNVSSAWAVALEEYAGLGTLDDIAPSDEQAHQLYGVVDYAGSWDVELGVGVGVTDAADNLTLKLILARDLN